MHVNRRRFFGLTGSGVLGAGMSHWFTRLAAAQGKALAGSRHCILLWMPGGPSQTDTFDMKPGHENGGEFKPISTSVPGISFSEHLPQLAKQAENLAIVRGLSTSEGDHNRGTYLMHTGHRPGGPISYPTIGSSVSKALGQPEAELPNFVSISPYTAFNQAAYTSGFLGPRYAPLTVAASAPGRPVPAQGTDQAYATLGVDDLSDPSVNIQQQDARLKLWRTLQDSFIAQHQVASANAQNTVYQRAVKMMRSESAKAFDVAAEADKVRDSYGRGRFGQGCLMARRLVERGVPFIELSLRGTTGGALGWDTHADNFNRVKRLSTELDQGWATLMTELKDRGLLESTTIIWAGEFGRTPKINANGGRDHFPAAWTSVLAGGGIKGGTVHGQTSDDGMKVTDGKTNVGDLFATLCQAAALNPATENISEMGRPIKIAEGNPIETVLS